MVGGVYIVVYLWWGDYLYVRGREFLSIKEVVKYVKKFLKKLVLDMVFVVIDGIEEGMKDRKSELYL